jgi:hypothetical protein
VGEQNVGSTEDKSQEIREKQYDRDVGLGNKYRLECIKHCMTLATGALVFTLTFKKDYLTVTIQNASGNLLATMGWLLLVLSLATGIWHMQCWEHYYFAWILEPLGKDVERKRQTDLWDRRARVARVGQYVSLALGLLCIALFVISGLWSPEGATVHKP